jgi:hypothetical protein
MTTKLLRSVGFALVLALPSGAWAGADNILSDYNQTTTSSVANAVGSNNTAISESYNTNINGVARQELTATVANTTVQITGDGLIHAGNAYAGAASSGTLNGLAQSGANSGIGGIVQQGLVLATGGAVKF